MARFASQKRHTTSIMHRFKFRLTCRAKDALFMHRAIMSSMDQVLLLCPRPLISLYVSIWASPLDLWYPRPRFRAWTSGAGREAGSWQKFAVETGITGARTSRDNYGNMSASLLGNVTQNTISVTWISAYTSGSISPYEFTSQQTMANETRPSNISVPVIVYLGGQS